ncbi:MAG: serine hydrolase family protein [Candidatus Sungbacteria bacterium]|nr:serine hydrolase family protein [Candidatus Sungbacteria bacterium]
MKRVFIVHGWGGDPNEGWFSWLANELEQRGFIVQVPTMPDTDTPVIEKWVSHLAHLVGEPDESTYLVGHSIGCQAIMRYTETLDNKIGGALFVAGWFHLTADSYEKEGDEEIAKPWIETSIDFPKVRSSANDFAAIFSDDDPFVPLGDEELFKERLGASTIVLSKRGHFSGSDGITKLPEALEALLRMSRDRV